MLKIEGNIAFKKAKVSDKAKITTLLKCFAREIWKKNRETLVFCIKGAIDDQKLSAFIEDHLDTEDFFLIQVNADLAGILTLSKDRLSGRFIQLVYVAPKYRHQGIASLAYSYALQSLSVEAISLTLRRAIKNPDYWRRHGFKSLVLKGADQFRYIDIIRLSIHSYPSKMSCDLDKQKIQAFRKRLSDASASIASIHVKSELKQSHQLNSLYRQQLREVA